MKISVIICTHNPRKDFFTKVLDALKRQTLKFEFWELILIDNCSEIPVAEVFDVSWHPRSRSIYEEKLGSTAARIRGIKEAGAEYILFVDDDNCLNSHYLEIALNKMELNPILGVLGSGKILPDFEEEPSSEAMSFTNMLALRNESRCYYSNEITWSKAIPYSAGMIIRRHLALDYVQSCENRTFAQRLGRVGKELLSGEDVDMALHACQRQFLAGVTPELEMIHLIPRQRLTTDYLVKIAAGHAYSHYMLGKMWGYLADYPENPVLRHLRFVKRKIRVKGLAQQVLIAERDAVKQARFTWNKASALQKNNS